MSFLMHCYSLEILTLSPRGLLLGWNDFYWWLRLAVIVHRLLLISLVVLVFVIWHLIRSWIRLNLVVLVFVIGHLIRFWIHLNLVV